jgi:membrane associated rhomboid family serine protease
MMMGGQGWSSMPPVVKNLLILNVLMYLASFSFMQGFGIDFWELFGLHYFQSDVFQPYQFITYMFMHSQYDISHLVFNMFAVWMFGSTIEGVWGSKRFLIYYLITGFGAAILHYGIIAVDLYPLASQMQAMIDNPNVVEMMSFAKTHEWGRYLHPDYLSQAQNFVDSVLPRLEINPDDQTLIRTATEFLTEYRASIMDAPNVVGASGSLFGILLAFGMMFPNVSLYMMFIPIPIKAKYFVAGYGLIELYSAFDNNPGDNVAHFAHLGGMLFGFILIKIWQQSGVRWR